MSYFSLNSKLSKIEKDEISKCKDEMSRLIATTESIKRNLTVYHVNNSLKNTIDHLYEDKKKLETMCTALEKIIDMYEDTEKKISNNVNPAATIKAGATVGAAMAVKPGVTVGAAASIKQGTVVGGVASIPAWLKPEMIKDVLADTTEVESTIPAGQQQQTIDNVSAGTTEVEEARDLNGVKTILKSVFDIGGGFGSITKSGAAFNTLLKIAVDGDGFTTKDIGDVIKGSGESVLGIMDLIEDYKGSDWKKMIGLENFETLKVEPEAGWWKKVFDSDAAPTWKERLNVAKEGMEEGLKAGAKGAGSSFTSTFKDQFTIFKDGTKKLDAPKAAGWALSLVANGFSNLEDYQKGEMSGLRATAETIAETIIDVGKGAAIAAGIAAGAAAIGVSAPAVVVAGAGVVVSAGLDWACEKLTGKSVTEATSDLILDVGEAITGGIASAGEAISGWVNKFKLAW